MRPNIYDSKSRCARRILIEPSSILSAIHRQTANKRDDAAVLAAELALNTLTG